ncbi:hypothetical protein PI124_g19787 [Phytophthora idaei]|nr:hypothetical protein PI124_g19787 [Phytophthora idaei]
MVPLKPRQRHASRFQRIRGMFNHVRTALSSSPPSPFNEHEDSNDDDSFIARGFEELTWEPAAHFSPKILRDFEQQYEDSLDAQSSDSSSKAEEGESNS